MLADHEKSSNQRSINRSPCITPAFPQLLATADASTHAPTPFTSILGHAPSGGDVVHPPFAKVTVHEYTLV